MNVFELFGTVGLKGTDKVNKELSGLEKNVQRVQKGMKVAGTAFTAMGGAGLAMIQSTKKINAALGVTALNLGATVKEMRDLTLATTNVTFPINEVTATFDLLARAGVKDQEVLKATAIAFDTLGDATGRSASQVAETLVPAMKTFNLSAEEMAKKTDIMTYMSRESTLSLEDFNTMVGYTTPELVEQGLTIEELTASLIHMERQGYAPGRVMTREFMKATTLAKKENISLSEALGITAAEMEGYNKELDGATGMTEQYAVAANEQYTLLDKVKQRFAELTLKASEFLEPLEPVLAGMTALGPVMILLSSSAGTAAIKWALHTTALIAHKIASIASAVAIKAVTAAQWLWNAAMSANPIGLLIVAIGALIAAGVLLYKNWDKVVRFMKDAWADLKIIFLTGVEKLLSILEKFTGWLPGLGDKVKAAHDKIADMLAAEKVKKDGVIVREALDKVEGKLGDVKEALKDNWEIIGNYTEATEDQTAAIEDNIEILEEQEEQLEEQKEAYEKALDKINDVAEAMEYERSEAGKLGVTIDDLIEYMLDLTDSEEFVAEGFAAMGEEADNVLAVMEYFGIGIQEITAYLLAQAEATKKATDAVDELIQKEKEHYELEKIPPGEKGFVPEPGEPGEPPPEEPPEIPERSAAPEGDIPITEQLVKVKDRIAELQHLLSLPEDEWFQYMPAHPKDPAAIISKYEDEVAQLEGFLAEGYTHVKSRFGRGGTALRPYVPLGEGGIAMGPALAMVGERAPQIPEVILPLDKLNTLGDIGGATYNFNIAKMIVRDERDIHEIARGLEKLRLSKTRRIGIG